MRELTREKEACKTASKASLDPRIIPYPFLHINTVRKKNHIIFLYTFTSLLEPPKRVSNKNIIKKGMKHNNGNKCRVIIRSQDKAARFWNRLIFGGHERWCSNHLIPNQIKGQHLKARENTSKTPRNRKHLLQGNLLKGNWGQSMLFSPVRHLQTLTSKMFWTMSPALIPLQSLFAPCSHPPTQLLVHPQQPYSLGLSTIPLDSYSPFTSSGINQLAQQHIS